MYYLATPYSHRDEHIRQQRYETACKVAAFLIGHGIHVYSPIAHSHGMVQHGLPCGYEFWRKYDMDMLSRLKGVIAVEMDGWRESLGMADEMRTGRTIGKRVATFRLDQMNAAGVRRLKVDLEWVV